jgi:hypothetical protein
VPVVSGAEPPWARIEAFVKARPTPPPKLTSLPASREELAALLERRRLPARLADDARWGLGLPPSRPARTPRASPPPRSSA